MGLLSATRRALITALRRIRADLRDIPLAGITGNVVEVARIGGAVVLPSGEVVLVRHPRDAKVLGGWFAQTLDACVNLRTSPSDLPHENAKLTDFGAAMRLLSLLGRSWIMSARRRPWCLPTGAVSRLNGTATGVPGDRVGSRRRLGVLRVGSGPRIRGASIG